VIFNVFIKISDFIDRSHYFVSLNKSHPQDFTVVEKGLHCSYDQYF